ncbi:MAG: ATP-dependent DNA helicase RecG [Candidatus Saccharibacteria bacterium]|nr:ATP-dependent DNA helicase RecG [Candidatus Saccharibacteria bacterium]
MNSSSTSSDLDLQTPIQYVKGIGQKRAELFKKLNIETVQDLIFHQPRRWEDFSKLTQIYDLKPGLVTVKVQILEASGRFLGYRGLHITEALAKDETGHLRIIWFNQPYRVKNLKINSWYYFSGKYDLQYKHLQLINPSSELINLDSSSSIQPNLIKPIYPTTEGLKSFQIQNALKEVKLLLSQIEDYFPKWLIKQASLPSLSQSLSQLHFPNSLIETEKAKQALDFRDLIAMSLGSQLLSKQYQYQNARKIDINHDLINQVISNLSFQLTQSQNQIVDNILMEMNQADKPLNRLIQGDVGSGKTILALLIAINLIDQGYQVALMAPTQILAFQHLQTIQTHLPKFLPSSQVAVLTSGLKKSDQQTLLANLKSGNIKLIIGTHSLLSENVSFKNLGLVIVDEQHRFGVEQRLKLLKKTDPSLSNILTLSATPIPRSLALVLYADLDISFLTEKPPDRLPIITHVINLSDRASKFKQLINQASNQEPIYVVCPAISQSSEEDALEKVINYFLKLESNLNYITLHGQMKVEAKEQTISQFQNQKYSILFSTSIIEAGLDIGHVNKIIIMSPERFGLAQLHQLRGRVGRLNQQGYCYLCPLSNQAPSERLQAIMQHQDGLKLSELDLQFRGPGTLYGIKQSGICQISQSSLSDLQIVNKASRLASLFLEKKEDIDQYQMLKDKISDYQQITHLN